MYCIKEKENQVQLIPCGFGKKKCDVRVLCSNIHINKKRYTEVKLQKL